MSASEQFVVALGREIARARKPRKRHPSEQQLHRQVAQYLDAVLGDGTFWTTFPAGGGGRTRGAILRGMGLREGMPDILVFHRGTAFGIELKSHAGGLSPAQIACHAELMAVGVDVVTCRSVEEVERFLWLYEIPTRPHRMSPPCAAAANRKTRHECE